MDMNSQNSWKKLAQKSRVPMGTILGVIFLFKMHPSVRSLWIGNCIALGGVLCRLWAAGHIEKRKVLTQGGPYAYTRNPLYFGSFFMALGIILAGQGYWLLVPFAIFFVVFYIPVMRAEEQDLFLEFGDSFREYSARVPLFFPGKRTASYQSSSFQWSRVVKNREHRNIASLILVEAVLILRLFFGQ